MFSDILSRDALSAVDARRLYEGMRFSEIATEADDRSWLQTAGPAERHAMCHLLQAQTVARLGQAHFDRYDLAYEHFVALYRRGVLGGSLFHARRPEAP